MCLRIIFTSRICVSFVLQSLLIIIKPWFQSFVISSTPTSIPSLSLPHLSQFFFYFLNKHVLKDPSKLNFIKLSFHLAITRMKWVPNKRVVPTLLRPCNLSKAILDCAMLNVFAISPCTGLQTS
jgi:hypothetical protein